MPLENQTNNDEKKNLSSKARHVALSTFFSGYIFESSASSGFTGEQMSSVTLAAASNSSPKWTPVERKSRDLLKPSTKVRGKLQDDVHMGSSVFISSSGGTDHPM